MKRRVMILERQRMRGEGDRQITTSEEESRAASDAESKARNQVVQPGNKKATFSRPGRYGTPQKLANNAN